MRRVGILLLAGALPAVSAAGQEILAVKAGRLVVAPGKVVPEAVLVVRGGRVHAYGPGLAIPAGARVVDHSGATVAPGLVDVWTRLTTATEVRERARAWTPRLRAADAIDPTDRKWALWAAAGITSVAVAPDPDQVGGGLACLVKTGPAPKVAAQEVFFQGSLDESARDRERPPTSLPGQVALLRRQVAAAREAGTDAPAGLRQAVAGELPWALVAGRRNEMAAAAALARELGLGGFLVAPPGHRRLPELVAATRLGVVLLPADTEAPEWRFALAARLARQGTKVAFASGAPGESPLALRLQPARACRYGLDRTAALAAVTAVPAALLGLEHCIGSLEPARDADFLVLDGDPLDPGTRILATWVEGRRVHQATRRVAPEVKR
jgi:imidazolonepropionase-like amidohydrolase